MNRADNDPGMLVHSILPAALTLTLLVICSAAANGENGDAFSQPSAGQRMVERAVKLVALSIKDYLAGDARDETAIFIDQFTGDPKLAVSMDSVRESLTSHLGEAGITTTSRATRLSVQGSVMATEESGKLRVRATIVDGLRAIKTIEAQITDSGSLEELLSVTESAPSGSQSRST